MGNIKLLSFALFLASTGMCEICWVTVGVRSKRSSGRSYRDEREGLRSLGYVLSLCSAKANDSLGVADSAVRFPP